MSQIRSVTEISHEVSSRDSTRMTARMPATGTYLEEDDEHVLEHGLASVLEGLFNLSVLHVQVTTSGAEQDALEHGELLARHHTGHEAELDTAVRGGLHHGLFVGDQRGIVTCTTTLAKVLSCSLL